MTREEFDEKLKTASAARFERAVVGVPRAMSEYKGRYMMLATVIMRPHPTAVDDGCIDCSDEALLGSFETWLDKVKALVPDATTIVWRRLPKYTVNSDFAMDRTFVKLYARAHALTEDEFERGPLLDANGDPVDNPA